MPFIDSKITVSVDDATKEAIKSELGKAISILHKPESYLMVGIKDEYDLYFAGKKLDKGAFVSVQCYGKPSAADTDRMTARICEIYQDLLGIPGSNIYITYQGIGDWGWNGSNF